MKSPTKVELTGDKVKILYQAVEKDLPAFRHAHKNDAGYDLYSTENAWIRSGETRAIMTNARVCIPAGMVEVKRGDRVAQLVILRLPEVELSEGDLPETERGKKGLGSTGR